MEKFSRDFVAGGVALSVGIACFHPLDSFKTLLQTGKGFSRGFFLRGFFSSVVAAFPQGGLRLATYETTKSNLVLHSQNTLLTSALSAVIADFCSSIVKVPREVITCRLQTSNSSLLACISDIYYRNGLLGFFSGFASTAARDVPFMVILFCTYESFKSYSDHFLYGGISGAIAGFFTTPFDVIKTRIIATRSSDSIIETARELLKQHKYPTCFFRGATARSVWWFGVCCIFFPTYESLKL